ncbi:MAG: GLPGLI family protein [Polaribacter sp.]|nr:GLPGLI family protein [Polaribacter sp.]MDG1810676.1 GLPGLI family protein [Polaribacter sp.]MDG1993525.1 GLPGLI family protein [Polaribacter sp.]
MKKRILFILFIAFTINIFSQNQQVRKAMYVKIHSFGEDNKIDTLDLYFNNEKSLFVQLPKKKHEKMKVNEDKEDAYKLNIRINPETKDNYAIYTSLKFKKIVSREFIYENGKAVSYIVNENINSPKWTIKNDFKIINRFKCRKATTSFRGRNYIAWFTEDIQTTIAPWKLSGLPGLIVEVSDVTNSIQFYLIKYENNVQFKKIESPSGEKEISLKQYATIKKQESKKIIEHLKSRFPRGSNFTVESVETNPLELSYEWETKKQ